ncbi:hypothetical protein DY000_02000237 [Brassica cretica]|uniref:PHD finger protein ALFIN-LIKE n=1 Tax=Brassica cretica TaxID=69181 RepID=A0ABQ7CLK2_BRACR|nr:hypothetical protein DY000_02000237 [Brassica cretica]
MFRRVVPSSSSSSSAQNGDMHRRVPSSSPLISDDYIPRTVEHIFINYRLRRVGLLRAFGTDAGTLYNLCDPGYKENLSLYGYPDGTWDVQEACMSNSVRTSPSKVFTPFGGGPRICPGYELARVAISVFLHHLVTSLSWVHEEQDKMVFFPTTRTQKRYPIIVKRRDGGLSAT